MDKLAKKLRKKSLEMALKVGKLGSHLGGGLSTIEIFAALYGGVLNFDSHNPNNDERDRVIVSKGHCVLAYYSVLHEMGFLTDKELGSFEMNGSLFHGHATRSITHGIDFSGGSLGLGFSYGVGVAIAGKLKQLPYHVYVIIGDGEMNEGIIWESFMSASHFKLDNLTVIIDNNKLQYDGKCESIMNMGSMKDKLNAFGMFTIEVDGHDVNQLDSAFRTNSNGMPKAIIANTVKGKGVSFMEHRVEWHHSTLSREQFDIAMSEQL